MKSIFVCVGMLAVLWVPEPLFAADNNHVALVFTGNYSQKFEPPAGSNPVEGYDVEPFSPEVELIVRPKSRISIGVEYRRLEFKTQSYHYENRVKQFSYTGGVYVYPEETATYGSDYTTTPRTQAAIGNLYVNLGKSGGPVQPFIGGGYGVGFVRNEYNWQGFVEPTYQQLTGFQFQVPSHHVVSTIAQIVSVKGGVRTYWKNLAVGGAAGYQNGAFGQFQAGIVF